MDKVKKNLIYLKTAEKYFKEIYEWIDKEKKNDTISFIKKIFTKIHDNPNVLKFRNLNISKIKKISKKWNGIPMMILFSAGFIEDIFNRKKMSLNLEKMLQFDKVTNLFFKIFNFGIKKPEKNTSTSTCFNIEKKKIQKPIYFSKNVSKNYLRLEKIELETKKVNLIQKKKDKPLNLKSMNTEVGILKIIQKKSKYISKFNIKKIQDLDDIEKIRQLTQKRKEFRIQKKKKKLQNETDKIKKDREASKAKTELKEKREEYQTKILIKHKKNEKKLDLKRKTKIREKIKKQKEERKIRENMLKQNNYML